jgi:hypothetical protein
MVFLGMSWRGFPIYSTPPNVGVIPVCGREEFIPYGMTMRIIGPTTAVFPTYTTTTTTTSTYTNWYWRYTSTTTWTTTSIYYGTLSAGRSTDVKDNQVFTFPNKIYAVTDMYFSSGWNEAWYYYRIAYKLAYIKVVNYWNTTETLAYTDGSSTLYVRADRPLGIAAVYVFDDVSQTIPPPPPPPPPPRPCTELKVNPYCTSPDAEGKVDVETPLLEEVPCGSFGENGENYRATIVATTNDEDCNGFITTTPKYWGPVPVDETTPCIKDGNKRICELTHPLQRVIWDCDH